MSVEVNSHGVNKLIRYNILSDERMKYIGFKKNYYEDTDHEEYSPYWWFTKFIEFPEEKRWKSTEISFDVKIPKDGSDIGIDVIDMDFLQPYDYQYLLSIFSIFDAMADDGAPSTSKL